MAQHSALPAHGYSLQQLTVKPIAPMSRQHATQHAREPDDRQQFLPGARDAGIAADHPGGSERRHEPRQVRAISFPPRRGLIGALAYRCILQPGPRRTAVHARGAGRSLLDIISLLIAARES